AAPPGTAPRGGRTRPDRRREQPRAGRAPAPSPGRRVRSSPIRNSSLAPPGRPPPTLECSPVCGRFTNTQRKSDEIQVELAAALGIEQPQEDPGWERFNISPSQEVVAVVEDPE